jgi:hypothetical protein
MAAREWEGSGEVPEIREGIMLEHLTLKRGRQCRGQRSSLCPGCWEAGRSCRRGQGCLVCEYGVGIGHQSSIPGGDGEGLAPKEERSGREEFVLMQKLGMAKFTISSFQSEN